MMRCYAALPIILASVIPYAATVEGDPANADAGAEVVSPWSHSLTLGAFLNQTAERNADSSRDSSIAGSSDSVSYRLSLNGSLTWAEGDDEVNQKLRLRYGRVKEDESPWRTNSDEIRYDVNYVRLLSEPHFVYTGGRAQTVFEEPGGSSSLTPGLAFFSAGYGQRHQNFLLPEEDAFEGKIGVRAQRRWGRTYTASEKEVDIGLEVRLEYSNTIREGIAWNLEVESFAPFDDLGHITTWAEIGLSVNVTDYVIATLGARLYYETAPDNANTSPGDGYDSLSLRQEALIGLSWSL